MSWDAFGHTLRAKLFEDDDEDEDEDEKTGRCARRMCETSFALIGIYFSS
jgi:hypothetical protein